MSNGTWEIGDADLIYTYVHDPASVAGVPLADLAGTNPSTGTARYYFGDNLGSTRRLRNASKTSLGQYEYQPYGEMYAETGATPKYKFAGMYYSSDLGTYYTLNRYYNPTLARWTTRDPSGMDDGTNVYAYVGNNPVDAVDVLGLSRCCRTDIFVCYRRIRAWYGFIGHIARRFEHTELAFSDKSDSEQVCTEVHERKRGQMRGGLPCSVATCEDIRNCVNSTVWGRYRPLFNDCHVYKNRQLRECCLSEEHE